MSRPIVVGLGIGALLAAAGTAALIATRQTAATATARSTGPLHVGRDVSLKVSPGSGGCGTTFTFVATGSLSGVGTLVYRWEQSDGRNTADLSIPIDKTIGSFDLHQSWRLEGSQEVKGSMSFHILKPDQRSATTAILYSCT